MIRSRDTLELVECRPHEIVLQLEVLTRMDPRTRKQLTDIDGISRSVWHHWITGAHSPSVDLLSVRAATLGRKIMLGSVGVGLDKSRQLPEIVTVT